MKSSLNIEIENPYGRISNAIIRRINYPAAKGKARNWEDVKPFHLTRKASLSATARPLLTEDEQAEVHQTVALILIQRNVLPEQRLSLGENGDWRAVFRAVRSVLEIDKRARSQRSFVAMESLPDDLLKIQPLPVLVDSPAEIREIEACYRQRLARKFRYAHSMALAAFEVDTTRTRKSTYRKAVATLKNHIRAAFRSVETPLYDGTSPDAKFVRDSRLRKYLESGETALNTGIKSTPQSLTLHHFSQLRSPIATEVQTDTLRWMKAEISDRQAQRATANL